MIFPFNSWCELEARAFTQTKVSLRLVAGLLMTLLFTVVNAQQRPNILWI